MTAREPLARHLRGSLKSSIDTSLWLAKIMVPASGVVFILEYTGFLHTIAGYLEPIMRFLRLPGEAALAILSAIFINLYGVIAMLPVLSLTLRQATILAVMTLIAHSLIIEPAITKRTGTPVARMLAVRVLGALLTGKILSVLLPTAGKWNAPFRLGGPAAAQEADAFNGATGGEPFLTAVGQWALDTTGLVLRIAIIVTVLLFFARWLRYIGVTDAIARRLGWFMGILGLSHESSPAWVVANTLGLTFGAAVLKEEAESGRLSKEDGDLLNHHLGVSHSLLEDTFLYMAIGLPPGWLIIPRFLLAVFVVWERRLEKALKKLVSAPAAVP